MPGLWLTNGRTGMRRGDEESPFSEGAHARLRL